MMPFEVESLEELVSGKKHKTLTYAHNGTHVESITLKEDWHLYLISENNSTRAILYNAKLRKEKDYKKVNTLLERLQSYMGKA